MHTKVHRLIKYFDFFGTNFNLRYKGYKRYKSFTGGIIFILFMIAIIIFSLISLISFFKRYNMTIIYYDMQISPTDNISFHNYSYGVGFLGSCDSNQNFSELFEYDLNYVIMNNSKVDKPKQRFKIGIHLCNYSDFYNKSSQTLDLMGVNGIYYCPDVNNNNIQGIYTDEIFSYLELTLRAKYIEEDYFDLYYNLLTGYDCKLHIFFPMTIINMYNHLKPFDYDLYDLFLQLSPISFVKRNVFYKIQKFDSAESYFFDTFKTKYFLDYSRYDDFNLYKSTNRFKSKVDDFEKFARVYLRADSIRTNISRKYQKISECIAQVSSIFSTLFIILRLIISFIDEFYANNHIIRNVYKFKDVKDTKTYTFLRNIKKKINSSKVKRLERISMIAEFGSFKPKRNKLNKLKVNFMDNSSDTIINKSCVSLKDDKKETEFIEKNEFFFQLGKNEFNNDKLNLNSNQNNNRKYNSCSNINNDINFYPKKNHFSFRFSNPKIGHKETNKKKTKEISLKFRFQEVFLYLFCFKIYNKNLKKKIYYLEKARNNFFYNLDIQVFMKKMNLIDIYGYILFEPYQNVILKFLSTPLISIYQCDFNVINHLNKLLSLDFNYQDINNFISSYNKLNDFKEKTKGEIRLSNIINIEMGHLFG